jgi:uncharacterized repeat protein (TIGR03943 family)
MEITVLVFLAAFLAFSYFAGRVKYFLAPEFLWLPLATSVALLAMAAARLRSKDHGLAGCDCHEDGVRQLPQSLCVIMLVVPMVLALVVNPTRYSSEGRKKRSLSLPPRHAPLEQAMNWVLGIDTSEQGSRAESLTLGPEPTVLELLTAVSGGYAGQLEGRFVTVLGQCDPSPGAQDGRFDLYRLVVTCCIADATAAAIEVVPSPGVAIETGGWVRVGGIIEFDSPLDPGLPVLHAATITKIAEPAEPYL